MALSRFLPAVGRRAIVVGSVAALVGVVSGSGLRAQGTGQQQTTPPPQTTPQTPAPAQQPPKDPLSFTTPAPRLVIITMTADGEKAFEAALTKAKEYVAKPDVKPELKQQAAHWKVSTAINELAPSTDGTVTLVMMLDQTVPNLSYNPFAILAASGLTNEQFKADIQPLEDKVNAGIKGFTALLLSPVMDMAAAAGGGH